MPTGLIRHTQKEDPARSNKKLFTAPITLFTQMQLYLDKLKRYVIKLMGEWRECIIMCSKKMQMQIFTSFTPSLGNMISKTKAQMSGP